MTEEFGWPPDAWRQMPAKTFLAWSDRAVARRIEQANRARRAEFEDAKKRLPKGGA